MKRVCVLTGIALLTTLTSCAGQSPSDKLASVFADYACEMHQLLEDIKDTPDKVGEVMKRRSEINDELEEAMVKTFGSEENAQKVYKNIPNKEDFIKALKNKAKAQCNPSEEILDGAVNELQ